MKPVYADKIEVRVFFEGVLFPYAKTISVISSPESVSCQIEVPPSIRLKQEEWAGMTCHIFYANNRVRELFGDARDGFPSNWPILFQGELTGESKQTSVSSESVVLDFSGHSKHFDQTLLYFYDMNRENSIHVTNVSMFLGNTSIEWDFDGLISRSTQILTTLAQRSEDLNLDTERNIAFTSVVLQILRSASERHTTFRLFDNKFKLSNRFAAYIDPDVKTILTLEMMRSLIDTRAQALTSETPLTAVLEIATNLMKYNWNHIPQPQLRTAARERLLKDQAELSPEDQVKRDAQTIYNNLNKLIDTFRKYAISQYKQIPMGEITLSLPENYDTRKKEISRSEFIDRAFKLLQTSSMREIDAFVELITVEYLFPGKPAEPRSEENSTPQISKEDASRGLAEENQTKIEDNKNNSEASKNVIELLDVDQNSLQYRDELNEFIITPNMQFAQPPKCNVILPIHMTGYGMRRNYMSEPTRLYGKMQFVPAGEKDASTVVEWYLAPSSSAYYYVNDSNNSKFNAAYNDFYNSIDRELEDINESGEDGEDDLPSNEELAVQQSLVREE